MDFFKITIYEDPWTVYLLDDDDEVVSPSDAAAEVLHEKKEIYFRKGDIRLNIVLHEIWHVYFGYCYLDSASLDMGQTEEVSSSLFADKCETMIEKARLIHKKLLELRDTGGT